MRKVFLVLFFLCSICFSHPIDSLIKESDFNIKSTVAILVQNQKDGSVIYQKNEKKLLNPASVQKMLTFGVSYLTLGDDYKFETALYKDNKNNLYIKLVGDTLLTQNDLVKLFSNIKTPINNIYIDDSIFDKDPYPNSWMEEDLWPNQRQITPYIIDKNFVRVAIKRSSLATKVDIIQNDPYKFAIINELRLGDKNDYKITKIEDSPIINFKGGINQDESLTLPVLYPEINFNIKLRQAIEKNNILHNNKIGVKKIPVGAKKIAFVSHSIEEVSRDILLNSDNFCAEVVFLTAGAKFINYQHPASLKDSIAMFKEILNPSDDIVIADASGVSRYNLLSCEFINQSLFKLAKNEKYKFLLAQAQQGTLFNRFDFLGDSIRAKTGTLANMSSIAGYLRTKKNKDIIFSIIIQNSPKRKAVLKNFENNVITLLYRKY